MLRDPIYNKFCEESEVEFDCNKSLFEKEFVVFEKIGLCNNER